MNQKAYGDSLLYFKKNHNFETKRDIYILSFYNVSSNKNKITPSIKTNKNDIHHSTKEIGKQMTIPGYSDR
jgi:hypothetical protein